MCITCTFSGPVIRNKGMTYFTPVCSVCPTLPLNSSLYSATFNFNRHVSVVSSITHLFSTRLKFYRETILVNISEINSSSLGFLCDHASHNHTAHNYTPHNNTAHNHTSHNNTARNHISHNHSSHNHTSHFTQSHCT